MMFFNSNKITTFQEVFDYITYDLDDGYALSKGKDGIFYVNKLSIGPNFVQYKTECHELADGLYNKVQKLYDLFQEETRCPNEEEYNKLLESIQNRLPDENSFSLIQVPLEERGMLVKHFEKKGYFSYLYKDKKFIRIIKKDS